MHSKIRSAMEFGGRVLTRLRVEAELNEEFKSRIKIYSNSWLMGNWHLFIDTVMISKISL